MAETKIRLETRGDETRKDVVQELFNRFVATVGYNTRAPFLSVACPCGKNHVWRTVKQVPLNDVFCDCGQPLIHWE